jgi:hypothetical protein
MVVSMTSERGNPPPWFIQGLIPFPMMSQELANAFLD